MVDVTAVNDGPLQEIQQRLDKRRTMVMADKMALRRLCILLHKFTTLVDFEDQSFDNRLNTIVRVELIVAEGR